VLFGFFKRQFWEEARSQVAHAGIMLLLPWIITAMTLLSGLISGIPVPLPYLLTATVITFAPAHSPERIRSAATCLDKCRG
jgi:hypothetical protein